jgi:hypothetical protein
LLILLIKVKSDTPTSFFFVVSKTAFLIGPLLPPPLAAPEDFDAAASFLRPARLVTAYIVGLQLALSHSSVLAKAKSP